MLCVVLLWIVTVPGAIVGTKIYWLTERIPNGDKVNNPCRPGSIWTSVLHWDSNGRGEMNPFGRDLAREGYKWTLDLCEKDSDRDGFTNGEELGDPLCSWDGVSPPLRSSRITHPGICEPLASRHCLSMQKFACPPSPSECPPPHHPSLKTFPIRFPLTKVPPQVESSWCYLVEVPAFQPYQVISFEPLVDSSQHVRQIALYGCHDYSNLGQGPHPCPSPECVHFITAWSTDFSSICFPPDAGFSFGQGGYQFMLLRLTWMNPFEDDQLWDSSGVILHYTSHLRRFDVGILTFGQIFNQNQRLRNETWSTSSWCTESCTQRLIQREILITHTLIPRFGTDYSIHIEQYRQGVLVNRLGDSLRRTQSLAYTHYPPVKFRAGDELKIECRYNATRLDPTQLTTSPAAVSPACIAYVMHYSRIGPTVVCQQDENMNLCYSPSEEDQYHYQEPEVHQQHQQQPQPQNPNPNYQYDFQEECDLYDLWNFIGKQKNSVIIHCDLDQLQQQQQQQERKCKKQCMQQLDKLRQHRCFKDKNGDYRLRRSDLHRYGVYEWELNKIVAFCEISLTSYNRSSSLAISFNCLICTIFAILFALC